MKKILLSMAFVAAIAAAGFGQVSIDAGDIGGIGSNFTQRTDTLPVVLPGSAGTGQTWDFSGLANHREKTITAVDPLTLPQGARFVGANIALHENGSVNNYFFNKSTNLVTVIGMTMDFLNNGDTVCVIFDDPDTMITFSSIMGTAFTSHTNGDTKSKTSILYDTVIMGTPTQIPVDSVRIIHHAVKTSLMDAEGTLTLPNGSVNALRQYIVETSIDSVYGYINYPPFFTDWAYFQSMTDTSTQYIWWTKYAGNAIVNMYYDAVGGNATSVDWLYIVNLGIANEAELSGTEVFPNPAQNQLNIRCDANCTLATLMDVTGKVVWSSENPGLNFSIALNSFDSGLYILQLRDAQGHFRTNKVMVQH